MDVKLLGLCFLVVIVINIKSVSGIWLKQKANLMSNGFGKLAHGKPKRRISGSYGKDQYPDAPAGDIPASLGEWFEWFKRENIPPPANWLHPHVYKKGANSQYRTALTHEKRNDEGGDMGGSAELIKDEEYINDMPFKWVRGKRREKTF